jgi:hypothetical protein
MHHGFLEIVSDENDRRQGRAFSPAPSQTPWSNREQGLSSIHQTRRDSSQPQLFRRMAIILGRWTNPN